MITTSKLLTLIQACRPFLLFLWVKIEFHFLLNYMDFHFFLLICQGWILMQFNICNSKRPDLGSRLSKLPLMERESLLIVFTCIGRLDRFPVVSDIPVRDIRIPELDVFKIGAMASV
ncbi:hypothetical protein ACOME3_008463 [Neoechinorhynchus agilis]